MQLESCAGRLLSPRELLARIRALPRRSRMHDTVADGLAKIRAYRFAGCELNVRPSRLTSPHAESVALTKSELQSMRSGRTNKR